MNTARILNLFTIMSMILCNAKCEIGNRKYPHHLNNPHTIHDTSIHKVTFTQRGYIQFLKYMTEVPEIMDFTFCIWLRSSNLTYSQPLLSYSKHEEDRYIRVWISNRGKDINMEILKNEIFKVPINIHENHWHHVCASWNSNRGLWSVYLNGKQKKTGASLKLIGIKIPPKGDLVVGQEYTDFDKGLDDGIEGDIFGFNMVLAATTSAKSENANRRQIYIPNYQAAQPYQFAAPIPSHGYEVEEDALFDNNKLQTAEVPEVLSYFKTTTNREPKGFLDFSRSMIENIYKILEPNQRIRVASSDFKQFPVSLRQANRFKTKSFPTKRIFNNEIDGSVQKPLGLVLVELGYGNCALGKGAPINDEKVLVSWTKTPVRVFGGAILKTTKPFCSKY